MGLATFKGGIHPYEGKELSENQPIEVLVPKGEMVYPLSQHIGAPATALVKKGDQVLVGQRIGEPGGFVSAPVISAVSGTVKAVEKRRVVNGTMADCIVIENDGTYTKVEGLGEDRDATKLSKKEIIDIVKDAGIVGLGGAGFPTHVKLSPKEPEKVVAGLKVMLQLFDNAKGVIAIENNKPEAIKKMKELVKDEPRIEVCELLTKYPQGGERTLIYAVTGRKVNSSMLPADAGCIVDNVDTVCAIYMAVCKTTPLMRRIVTVTGDAIANPKNFSVLLGTNYQEVIEAAGGFKQDPEKVISGGPMMGMAMFTLDVPVAKTSSAITCLTKDQVAEMEPTACIRCGRCVSVCPENLVPQKMMKAAMKHDLEQFKKLNGMECVECGCCSWICPARKQLTQAFKEMRVAVRNSARK